MMWIKQSQRNAFEPFVIKEYRWQIWAKGNLEKKVKKEGLLTAL